MSASSLDLVGANFRAKSHVDVMISDHTTTVSATGFDGGETLLIKDGKWVFDPPSE